jgi:hypothetical protein
MYEKKDDYEWGLICLSGIYRRRPNRRRPADCQNRSYRASRSKAIGGIDKITTRWWKPFLLVHSGHGIGKILGMPKIHIIAGGYYEKE